MEYYVLMSEEGYDGTYHVASFKSLEGAKAHAMKCVTDVMFGKWKEPVWELNPNMKDVWELRDNDNRFGNYYYIYKATLRE